MAAMIRKLSAQHQCEQEVSLYTNTSCFHSWSNMLFAGESTWERKTEMSERLIECTKRLFGIEEKKIAFQGYV